MAASVACAALISAEAAEPAPEAPRAADVAEPAVEQEFWLRRYSPKAFGAHWHIDLRVKELPKARSKIFELMEKHGGKSPMPVESYASSKDQKFQQLSYWFARASAAKALKGLRRLGKTTRLTQSEDLAPDYADEIGVKLGRLTAERTAGGDILKRLTAISALTDEIIGYLSKIAASHKESQDRILLNIVLEESGE